MLTDVTKARPALAQRRSGRVPGSTTTTKKTYTTATLTFHNCSKENVCFCVHVMGLHKSRELAQPQSSPEKDYTPHHSDHIASSCDQKRKHWKNPHDATSSTPVDENEPYTQRGVQEFFCLVEFFSSRNQNHTPSEVCRSFSV